MRRNLDGVSASNELLDPLDEDSESALSGAESQQNALTPEFYYLISTADPDAANDDYYVTDPEFVQLHSKMKKDVFRGLMLWLVGHGVFMAGLAFIYQ
mgnify:CR=1 FL=1